MIETFVYCTEFHACVYNAWMHCLSILASLNTTRETLADGKNLGNLLKKSQKNNENQKKI